MVPRGWAFLDRIPRLPSGKLDRQALPPPTLPSPDHAGFVPARNEVEKAVASIWARLLGDSPIGVTSDFFQLGGDSLMAVRLVAAIEKQFRRKLRMSDLYPRMTVEKIARLLRSPSLPRSFQSLVAINPGGSRPPFFFLHPNNRYDLRFSHLARELGLDQPFYAMRPYLDGKRLTYLDMAHLNIEELKRIQRVGPYFLGGYCFGGNMAFRMASIMAAQGEDVAFLGLVDAYSSLYRRPPISSLLGSHLRRMWTLPHREWPAFLSRKLNNLAHRTRRRLFGIAGAKTGPLSHFIESELPPALFPGTITLFRIPEGHRDYPDGDPCLGWKALARAIDIVYIPGVHTSLFNPPQVGELAALLRQEFDEAKQRL